MASTSPSTAKEEILTAVSSAAASLGYDSVKPQQLEVVQSFLAGNDVFVALPTGYGKSFCYGCLPGVFRQLGRDGAIVIVVSPLVALMKDQVDAFKARGVAAVMANAENEDEVVEGKFSLVYISPEMLLTNRKYRLMFRNEEYRGRLVALVVDEAHCVKKWGDEFRTEFSRLGEIRSLLPKDTNIMALTATATRKLRLKVMKILGMKMNSAVVSINPHRSNIIYGVAKFASMEESFMRMIMLLKTRRTDMPRTLVYCQMQDQCARLYLLMRAVLGSDSTHPPGSPNLPKFRLFDCFTSSTHPLVKDEILRAFTTPSSLRVVVATIAFGMGVDTPDIRNVVHWGPPEDIEQYVQSTGRAGRDGAVAHATLLCGAGLNRHVDKNMKKYCSNNAECRRQLLFTVFDGYVEDSGLIGCTCCDLCKSQCECGACVLQELFP